MAKNEPCGAEVATTDTNETFACARDPHRLPVHKTADGTRFAKVPGGVVADKRTKA